MSDEVGIQKDKDIFPFLMKHWKIILLLAILIFTFYLRFYHVDYPVVGYHNWKETHYLTEARNFADNGFFEHGLFIPEWDYPIVGDDPSGAHGDSLPTTSIIVGFLFMIFGESLFIARFTNIIFMLGTIVFLYLFTKELTNRDDMAFTVAALAAITPLFIFFGRQMQLVNVALFFMVGAGYFYLRWRKNINFKNTIWASIFLVMAFLTKYDFFIIFLPILVTFPYKKIFNKEFIKENKKIFKAGLLLLLIPIWLLYTRYVASKIDSHMFADALDFKAIFKSGWVDSVWIYIADSFTHLGFWYAIAGLIVVLFFMRKRVNKFFLAFVYTSPIWIIVASGYLKGHVYHQYPIAPLVLLLIAYFFVFVGANIEKMVKIKYFRIIVILVLLFTLYAPAMEAKDRMFNTQFPGLDIAGEYIKENSEENEWLVFPSHQSYGVLWHADRKGYGKGWKKLDEFKQIEEEQNVRWVFVYQWGMDIFQNEEMWNYISSGYSLKQVAFTQQGDQAQPIYFLLEKGGSFDINAVNDLTKDKEVYFRDYEYSFGVSRIMYVNV